MNSNQKVCANHINVEADILEYETVFALAQAETNPVTAFHQAMHAIQIANIAQDQKQAAKAKLLLVGILINIGSYAEALNMNVDALNYFRDSQFRYEEARCWRFMAIIHKFLNDYGKQLASNKKALTILRNLDKPFEVLELLNNIGDTYLNLKRYYAALEIFEQNLKNPHATPIMIGISIKNIAKTYLEKKDYAKAESISKKTIQYGEKHDIPIIITASNYFLGVIAYEKQSKKEAVLYFERAFTLGQSLPQLHNEHLLALEKLLTVLLELNQTSKAAAYFQSYQDLNKKITLEIQNKNIRDIQFRFEISEIEKERLSLAEQNKALKLAKDKIEAQRNKLVKKSRELEEVNKELRNFAHIVSHDIREPLRTVSSFSVLLEKSLADTNGRAKEYLGYIQTASQRMTTFVCDVLNYSTATQAQRPIALVDCNTILAQIKFSVNQRLKETQGQLNYDELPIIEGHSALITQIFQNLISNGLKFNKPGLPPIVKVSYQNETNHHVFFIADNGIGIKAEHQDRVFHLFQRLNDRTAFEGSGIGLSTVQQVLKKYNGTIELESEFGIGTTFIVRLPKIIEEED